MVDKLRVGVIGTGTIAMARHIPAYLKSVQAGSAELVAVCDAVPESAHRAAEQFGIPRVYTDWQQMLADGNLDLVSVCTPNVSHEPISLVALSKGLHVLCEKPIATSYAGAKRMADAAGESGRQTAVNFRYRYIPAAGFVHDLIQGGELGEIYHVYVNYFNGSLHDPETPLRWRQLKAEAGSGVLGDLASHLVDLCRYWIGEISTVTGQLRTFVTERPLVEGGRGTVDADDAASFFARFANGAEGVFNASSCAIGRSNHQRAEIYGTKGALIYEIEKGDRGGDKIQLCLGSAQANHLGWSPVDVPPRYLAGHPERPMIDFVGAVRAGKPYSPNFEDGTRCQEVLEAVEISAREGRTVRLPLEG